MKRMVSYYRWAIAAGLLALGWAVFDRSELRMSQARPVATVSRERTRPADSQNFRGRFQEAAGENDSIGRDAELLAVAGSWIGANPKEALDFARQMSAGEIRNTFLRQLLVAWAERDAAAAMAWTEGLADTTERRADLATISTALAISDPRSALELAIQHGADEEETGGLLENLAMQWAERETSTALKWVGTQPNGEWHDRLIARVAFVLAKSDPRSAAFHVTEEMEAGPMQDEAVISILHQWTMIDSESAARWVESFAAGALRDRALGELTCLDGMKSHSPPSR
ncbi:MAG: hypothetical protein ABI162_14820 [Luteolibacter sp.]